jgi:NADH-quinone oxidoreductase subunit K
MTPAPWLFSRAPLENLLVVAAILFCCGLYTLMTRKNAVAVLMGVEMVLNSANINFVAFAQYTTAPLSGNTFAVFVILLAAAEAAVALAIVIGIYQNFRRVEVDRAVEMKE